MPHSPRQQQAPGDAASAASSSLSRAAMSATLTAVSRSREVIDLTLDATGGDVPAVPRAHPRSKGASFSSDQPPSKRRRVDHAGITTKAAARSRSRPLKACLTVQVLPHVFGVTQRLSRATHNVDQLAQDIVVRIAQTANFRCRFDESRGYLTAQDENFISAQVRVLVDELRHYAKYRAAAPPPQPAPLPAKRETVEAPILVDEKPPIATPPTKTKTEPAKQHRRHEHKIPVAESRNLWFQRGMRPYKMAEERENIRRGVMQMKRVPGSIVRQPTVYHVDFTPDEVAQMVVHLNKLHQYTRPLTLEGLRPYIFENAPISMIVGDQVPRRTAEDVRRFCSDILAGRAAHPDRLRVLSFGPEDSSAAPKASDDNDDDDDVEYKEGSHMSALLLAREYSGNAGFGRMRRYANFQSDLPRCIEDDLRVVAEFTNCAGDIATISWVSDADMVCGTTTHSDSHNQQYNKPGNLLLGSLAAGRLQAYPDHCIPRPLVAKGDNATEAMRQSQDQWLYSSVVSSDYDPVHRRAYTSSFDGTVKVWKVEDDDDAVARGKPRGKHMTLLATWRHDGNVNFVVAAKDGSGRVATAADTPTQAVRIYTVDPGEEADIEASPYTALSCSRHDADGTDKWAYHPAALRWGPAEGTQHILAVGYSPRAATGDDVDIPEEKRNSGEIVLWDARAGRTIPLTNVTTANVFEIAWHPTLPRFVCATSPCGSNMAHGTRTQIHVFQRDPTRPGQDVAADPPAFCGIQALDCAAKDVNELTYVPNSPWHAYVTAGCTDGRVYVWDTARPDAPLHVLRHGASLDGHAGPDREDRDTGVKMTAWAASFDRLYTGSSDGVVKVWNVRHPTRPLVRVLLEAPAPISAGAFSPDGSRLAVGDATGRVFFLSPNKADEPVSHAALLPSLPGMPLRPRRRRPVPYTPHKEPPPPQSPTGDDTSNDSTAAADDSAAAYARRTYLSTSRLVPTGIPTIGVVQGPAYPTTGPFCLEAHASEDPSAPLLPSWQRQQRHSAAVDAGSAPRALRRLAVVRRGTTADKARHRTNRQRDLRVEDMARDEVERLARDGALLPLEGEEEWAFGPGDEEEW